MLRYLKEFGMGMHNPSLGLAAAQPTVLTAIPCKKGDLPMAYKITDECTMCGTCVPECAFEAISEGDPKYVIDADVCTDCGACEAVCPASAIAEG
jgi:ferredoxin